MDAAKDAIHAQLAQLRAKLEDVPQLQKLEVRIGLIPGGSGNAERIVFYLTLTNQTNDINIATDPPTAFLLHPL